MVRKWRLLGVHDVEQSTSALWKQNIFNQIEHSDSAPPREHTHSASQEEAPLYIALLQGKIETAKSCVPGEGTLQRSILVVYYLQYFSHSFRVSNCFTFCVSFCNSRRCWRAYYNWSKWDLPILNWREHKLPLNQILYLLANNINSNRNSFLNFII